MVTTTGSLKKCSGQQRSTVFFKAWPYFRDKFVDKSAKRDTNSI